ncbi:MAG: tetratricopeptide repeat protein [Colwellia sp.]|nr:tetratricopeptide repeat protein [Colwellia sp.]MCW8866499.1 tetratricopeptide repeat protein [Colwellia sp.]MCW9080688.1 tetratricopeptide repeat protein [Colwellia sp.]
MRERSKINFIILAALFIFYSTANAADRNNTTCDIEMGYPLTNAYGPWDYTNSNHEDKLPIVLRAHFNRDVASLTKGMTGLMPHGDLDYTLRAIPNYHPALFSVYQLEKKDRNKLKPGELYKPKYYTAECYLKRAIYLQPKDHISRMLYGMYLQQNKQFTKAEVEYKHALALQPNDPELNYNIGLLYTEMKLINKASEHAKIAYAAGHPLPGLKNKIAKLKQEQNK